MASKLQEYSQMADHAAVQITGSHQCWMAFLQAAAQLYKYPYIETELRDLTDDVLEKLETISDKDFTALELFPDFDE